MRPYDALDLLNGALVGAVVLTALWWWGRKR